MQSKDTATTQIAIYRSKEGTVAVDVRLEKNTVWLTQKQIAELFGTQRPAITKHLGNIFTAGELNRDSVCSILEHTAADGKKYSAYYYNLDAIISIGYRVNSGRATQFRIWATNVLKQHLIEGYSLNEKLLQEQRRKLQNLGKALELVKRIKTEKPLAYNEAMGLLDVVGDYSYALGILDDFDRKKLKLSGLSAGGKFKLTYDMARKGVVELKAGMRDPGFFGKEKDESFKSSIAAIYQTFGGKELYPSIEEKAANLLYFIIKNHSFVDGNKRIAASLFLWFLEKNGILYKADGSKRVADNALVALTLMIAESSPSDKEIMATLVVNLINRKN